MIYGNVLFSSVPEGFFGVLNGSEKETNAEILLRTYDYIEQNTETMKISRDRYDYIVDNVLAEIDDDPSSDFAAKKAYMLRRFIESGWLITERSIDGKEQYISFPPYAVTQIRALKSIIAPSRISMGEYVRTALKTLRDLTVKGGDRMAFAPYSMLSHAEEDIQYFNNGFTKLDEECKKRLRAMLSLENADTKTVVSDIKAMLDEINEGMIAKLNREEVLDGTISSFEKYIRRIREDTALREIMVKEASFGLDSPDEERIQEEIDAKLGYIYNQICNACKPRQRELYNTVSAYFRTARRKLMMSVNPSGKAEQNVSDLLKALKEAEEGSAEWDILKAAIPSSLPAGSVMDTARLYVPRSAPVRDLEEEPFDEEEVKVEASDVAALVRKYSRAKIRDYYDNVMGERKVLPSKELVIMTREDFDRLICLFIYDNEDSADFPFYIERTGKYTNGRSAGYPEFLLKRKEKKDA